MSDKEQPKGIGFFNIKSGRTHYASLEPQIQAYINSSDMGVNASRGQDYGWRLDPEWVKAVKEFRRDQTKMSILTSKSDGRSPTTVTILYYLFGEQLRNHAELEAEDSAPFEEKYLQDIANNKKPPAPEPTKTNKS